MAVAVNNNNSSNSSNRVQLLPNSGRELLLDLKRSTQQNVGNNKEVPVLPTYNNKLVQSCLQDLHGTIQELELKTRLQQQARLNDPKPGMSDRPSILLHDKTIRRHKQCLLAYHHYRMEIIKNIQRSKMAANDMTMIGGGGGGANSNAASSNGNGGPISTNAQEVDFAHQYSSLREQYSNSVFELDVLPPTSHMVQVRVLQNIGQIVLPDSGRSISMNKGSCLFLDRADVTDFLRQGLVQLYDGEEVDF
ncbi:hypothetical protein FRACYDRAFT_256520 [Fragilariopsis cylindrus CCMP1102]|uniref:DNA replication complex GINS protein PSF1 C-terminal domain-containing protein n=1 Tax=Fragilariopsis cylindrus CCMP1102 TaxID=635003 RepID=A0A1E7EJN1_9STRA|nr:hypothetical protein FRACYDRAFT_256520 [Fragilariopsis cylindrus CCMP1102]|eukprot:OEU06095.1 hypothetical protein FRACYDRAFT_256520 [Fragilariopsis cylindrus CCMP1102]